MTQTQRVARLEELRTNDTFVAICETIKSVEKIMAEDLEAKNFDNMADFLAMRQKLIIKWSEMTGFRYRSSSESAALVVACKQATVKTRHKRVRAEKQPDKRIIRLRTKNFERLSKHEAFLLLTDKKETVYMFPNKVLPDNNWMMPTEVKPDEIANKADFNRIVDSFKFYNCNLPYLGTYVSFYKKAV